MIEILIFLFKVWVGNTITEIRSIYPQNSKKFSYLLQIANRRASKRIHFSNPNTDLISSTYPFSKIKKKLTPYRGAHISSATAPPQLASSVCGKVTILAYFVLRYLSARNPHERERENEPELQGDTYLPTTDLYLAGAEPATIRQLCTAKQALKSQPETSQRCAECPGLDKFVQLYFRGILWLPATAERESKQTNKQTIAI